ncbi:MAG: FtsX-like permease family protein [Pseudomonadota bacterium]
MTRQGVFSSKQAGDVQAEDIVPPSGFTARLTIFAAAAMAFLAVFALALAVASARLAVQWGGELAQTSTVRISAPREERDAQAAAALRILESTAGVAFARALDDEEQRALLTPWFGDDLDLRALPVPRLIEVIEEDSGFDAEGLRLRLAAEVPGAVLDDHARWRAPLVATANRLWILGLASAALLVASVAAMVTLAANASLAANVRVIEVLRLIGATDRYIARAFVRRYTLRTAAGAMVGAAAGFVVLVLLPRSDETALFLPGLRFAGLDALWVLLIPLLAASTAYLATGRAARRTLQGLA